MMNDGLSRRAALRGAGVLGVGALGLATTRQAAFAATSTPSPSPTPSLAGAPQMTVTTNSPRAYQGQIYFTGGSTPGNGAAEIAAPDGTPLWFISSNPGQFGDFQLQTFRDRPVLTWWQATPTTSPEDVITTLSHEPVTTLGNSAYTPDLHEFRITARNTALITVMAAIPYDLSSVGGPVDGQLANSYCLEVDIATGEILLEWSAADHVPLTDSYVTLADSPPGVPYDYFHMNSISITPDDQLLISSRHCCALYKLDRKSGEVLWTLGGKAGSFDVAPDAVFAYQHHAIHEGFDTIRLFDDGSDGLDTWHPSRVVWLKLDTRRKTVSLADSMTIPGIQAVAMGSAQRLPNGNVFVSWGSAARLSEFSASGEVLFDAKLTAPSYRGYKFRTR
jgi:arylsulfotransferase ASST